MPLDHFANSTVDGVTTFQNRYWINATYYEPGGPVFSKILHFEAEHSYS